jgi:hypothetical protein
MQVSQNIIGKIIYKNVFLLIKVRDEQRREGSF